jgi:phosphoglycolate phosphatase-like HAD superfamily hydrolase
MITAVGFDLDHTLGMDQHLEHTVLREMLLPTAPAGGAATLDVDITDALNAYREHGAPLSEALHELFWRRFGNRAHYQELLATFKQRAQARVAGHMRAFDGLAETFERLRSADIQIAVLTNGWNPLQAESSRHSG